MKTIKLKESDIQRISKKVLNEITSDDITKGVNRQMYRSRITNMDSPEDFLGHDFETIGQAKDKEWDKEEERKQDIHDEIYNQKNLGAGFIDAGITVGTSFLLMGMFV